jgi:hypothetical protein
MPVLKDVHFYPYSGSSTRPWGVPGGQDARPPFTAAVHNIDAAARSSRRVTEQLSMSLHELGVTAPRASYRIFLAHQGETNSVRVLNEIGPRYVKEFFLGNVEVPNGFRTLAPDLRAELLTDAVSAKLLPIARAGQWEQQLDRAVSDLRASGYRCEWTSPWKTSPDRKLRVRIVVAFADDGYGRWQVQIAEPGGEILRETAPILGWTWISNFQAMAKQMRFAARDVLEVGSGSGFMTGLTSIDLATAAVIGIGYLASAEEGMLTYPGVATSIPVPHVEVLEHERPRYRIVQENGISRAELIEPKPE